MVHHFCESMFIYISKIFHTFTRRCIVKFLTSCFCIARINKMCTHTHTFKHCLFVDWWKHAAELAEHLHFLASLPSCSSHSELITVLCKAQVSFCIYAVFLLEKPPSAFALFFLQYLLQESLPPEASLMASVWFRDMLTAPCLYFVN